MDEFLSSVVPFFLIPFINHDTSVLSGGINNTGDVDFILLYNVSEMGFLYLHQRFEQRHCCTSEINKLDVQSYVMMLTLSSIHC